MGRNLIKKLDGVEPVAATLQQLWISYNSIEKLVRGCAQHCTIAFELWSSNALQYGWGKVAQPPHRRALSITILRMRDRSRDAD